MRHPTLEISPSIRRRFILGRQGLWPGRRWKGKEGLEAGLREIEAVQIDPVSILAQSHELVLWGRVVDFQARDLLDLLYQERKFFDYGGAVFIYPMAELPYWRVVMDRMRRVARWEEFATQNKKLVHSVREEIRNRGPTRKRDLAGNQVIHYRGSKDSGVALYYLWLTGELMSYGRQGRERIYDFLENIAPLEYQKMARPEEADDYFARKTLAHSGMVSARDFRNKWRGYLGRNVETEEANRKIDELVADGIVTGLQISGESQLHFILATDLPLVTELKAGRFPNVWHPIENSTDSEVVFLSPLEYVSARGRASRLFDFDYIWEIYKPAAKRVYGPYTLPILFGEKLVGRLDAKYERSSCTLLLNGLWFEDGFDGDHLFWEAFRAGLVRLKAFLGAEEVDPSAIEPKEFQSHLEDTNKDQTGQSRPGG